MARLSKEDKEKICFLYSQGKKVGEIASIMKIDRHTPTDVLKKAGLYKQRKSNRNTEYDSIIIQYYNEGLSIKKISEKLNIGKKRIKNCLENNNIRLKDYSEYRKHTLNESIFEIIDTEEKAYWLGFLYADGYVNTTGWTNQIQLGLSNKDVNHLEKFKEFLQCDYDISYKSSTDSVHLNLNSKKMAQDLTNKGCFQAKSLTLKFPTEEQVPNYLIHHFMRGYFDGDGCIYFDPTGQAKITIAGNHNFLNEYENKILKELNRTNKNNRRKIGNIETFSYGGNRQVKKIYNFLYKDSTIYLDRKHVKFNALMPSQDEADNNLEMISAELSGKTVKSKDTQPEPKANSDISQGQSIDDDPSTDDRRV